MLISGKLNYKTKNIWFKKNGWVIKNDVRPLIQDLDSLPFPDKDLFKLYVPDKHKRYTIMTSRGCPYTCTYCTHSYQKKLYYGKGKYFRRRSVSNVIAELKFAKSKYNCSSFIFHDDTFNCDIPWLKEFVLQYKKEISLPFFCWLEPSNVNLESIKLLKRANCCSVEMGVQSVDEDMKKRFLNRYETNEQIKYAMKLLYNFQIYCTVDIIFGLPMQNEKALLECVKFFNENRPDDINIFWLKIFPKTTISKWFCNTNYPKNTNFYTFSSAFNQKIFVRIQLLLLFTMVLPRFIIRFIIDNRVYNYFPIANYFFLSTMLQSMGLILATLKKKKVFVPQILMSSHYRLFLHKKLFTN